MSRLLIFVLALLFFLKATAQYPPAAGQEGTTAIHADSSVFIDWASDCEVDRGYLNISIPDSGFVNFGHDYLATGKADNNLVSLGDGGMAILTFDKPIINGPGPDFAVFENAFTDNYLELAFVEVSSNGVDYVRFPCVSLTQTEIQIEPFGLLDPTKLHNLAGKYRVLFGVPFNLDDLEDLDNLDANNITHVKIISIVGSIIEDYTNYDSQGNIINDPWPTMFPSGGFDLDAVGIINNSSNSTNFSKNKDDVRIYPNPVEEHLNLQFNSDDTPYAYSIFDVYGACILDEIINSLSSSRINLESLPTGIYFVQLNFKDHNLTIKFLKK